MSLMILSSSSVEMIFLYSVIWLVSLIVANFFLSWGFLLMTLLGIDLLFSIFISGFFFLMRSDNFFNSKFSKNGTSLFNVSSFFFKSSRLGIFDTSLLRVTSSLLILIWSLKSLIVSLLFCCLIFSLLLLSLFS